MQTEMDANVSLSPKRRPRNWDVLQALESVSPPSPSPSFGSDFLGTLASTGEIPIFLDSGDSKDALYDLLPSPPRSVIPPSSGSVDTIQTVGTFGLPRRKMSDTARMPRDSYSSQDSYATTATADSGYTTPTSRSSQYLSPLAERGYYEQQRLSTQSSRFTLSAYLSPRLRKRTDPPSLPGSPRSVNSGSPWNTPSPSMDTLNSPDTCRPSMSIGASLSTIVFAAGSGSASPTVSSALTTDAQAYASRHRQQSGSVTPGRQTQVDFPPSSPKSPDIARSRTPTYRSVISRPNSPLAGRDVSAMGPRPRTKSSATTRSNDSGCSGHSGRSGRSTHSTHSSCTKVARPYRELAVSIPGLPPVLSWLQNVGLELWIDQEGFRLVRPAFTLSGYTTPSADRDADLVHALTHGTAEFRPVERQHFVFHHGALDPPPVLRKLTMAGDDSRDYISRQASLAVKANGVYFVSGTESFEAGPAQEALRLTWRFDYLVEDSARGGEKVLTPLTFACSPGLLHPTHGKKIRIIQVVKKTLTPKLAAAKMHPPRPGTDARRPRVQTDGLLLSPPRAKAAGAGAGLFKHRRAHSSSEHPLLEKEDAGIRGGAKKNRTASLAIGPRAAPAAPSADPLTASLSLNRRLGAPRALEQQQQLSRHILPPTELAELLDGAPTCEKDVVHDQSLRPPPRHRRV